MLPPNPHSRQSSYAHPRQASYMSHSGRIAEEESSDDDLDDEEVEIEMGLMDETRGLEETLEKLGFGMYLFYSIPP